MLTMRELMEAAKPETSGLERLADLAVKWHENDEHFGGSYARNKKAIASAMLGLDHVAAGFRSVPQATLYRAYRPTRNELFALFGDPWNARKPFPRALTIMPRSSDLLASWTTDKAYAYEHASQFETAIIITMLSRKLDVFLDLDLMSKALGDDWSLEGEVLVRPTPLTIGTNDVEMVGGDESD